MNTSSDPIVIVAAKRTPIGSFQGQFTSLSSPQLAAAAIAAAVDQSRIQGADISEAIIGCVLPAGVGQAPKPIQVAVEFGRRIREHRARARRSRPPGHARMA